MENEIRSPLVSLVNATLEIEKLRVAAQVRETHLELQGRKDPETIELIARILSLEEYVDGRIAKLLEAHPAYPWFSRVKGVGKENIAKVVGLIDIRKANTISGLWKFAGFDVQDGKAPVRVKGSKTTYNSRLRSMCWRLGSSLLRARGKYYDYYLAQKERLTQRYLAEGKQIVPAASLPKVDGKKRETDAFISEGHVHNMALRKMIKLFLSCLWLVWREVEGLPTSLPYPLAVLKHNSFIDPWEMIDK